MLRVKYFNNKDFSHSVSRASMGARVIKSIGAKNVLVLSPHPDDDIYGCGGLLAYLSETGAKIRVVYFDDGARGNASGHRESDLIRQREEEAVRALRVIGVSEVKFMRQKNIAKDKNLWHLVLAELKIRQNDLALVPSEFDWHPDHVAVANAFNIAIKRIVKHKPKHWSYFVWGVPRLNLIFPIEKYQKAKAEASACHKSQLKIKPYDEAILSLNEYLGKSLGVGKSAEGYYEN